MISCKRHSKILVAFWSVVSTLQTSIGVYWNFSGLPYFTFVRSCDSRALHTVERGCLICGVVTVVYAACISEFWSSAVLIVRVTLYYILLNRPGLEPS